MVHLDLPVDGVGAEFQGQKLIEENDETLPDVAVVEIFRTVHVHRFVIPLKSPVPLVGTEGVQMVVDPGPDSFPHLGVRDDPLVSPNYQQDVDEDDLVAPVIFHPEIQMVWLPSAEVRQKLNELDQAELEVSLTEDLLLSGVLSSSALDKLSEVRELVFLVNFLASCCSQ